MTSHSWVFLLLVLYGFPLVLLLDCESRELTLNLLMILPNRVSGFSSFGFLDFFPSRDSSSSLYHPLFICSGTSDVFEALADMVAVVNIGRVGHVTVEKLPLGVAYDRENQSVEWGCRLCMISWIRIGSYGKNETVDQAGVCSDLYINR